MEHALVTRNVLLMLSTKQPPHPLTEVRFHAAESAARGSTWLVTTRISTRLEPGRSVVALYGDVALGNRLLGSGVFRSTVPLHTRDGDRLLAAHPLYRETGIPRGAAALLELTDVREAPAGAGVEWLDGIIEATSRPLTLANLPRSAARGRVYYVARDPHGPARRRG